MRRRRFAKISILVAALTTFSAEICSADPVYDADVLNCSKIDDPTKRSDCISAAIHAKMKRADPNWKPTLAPRVPKWTFNKSEDSFSGKPTFSASVTGSKIDGPTILDAPYFSMGCSDKGNFAYFVPRQKISALHNKLEIRIDNGTVKTERASHSIDHTALGWWGQKGVLFAKSLTKAQSIKIRLITLFDRVMVLEFDITGAKEAIEKATKACRWN